jgi:hypothetical protein
MTSKGKLRRFLESIHLAYWMGEVGLFFFHQWVLITSALLAIGSAFWTWSVEKSYLPVFLVGLGVFVATIWGLNGIVWLQRQKRPSKQRVSFDYNYGLALETVHPSLDADNVDNHLEFRLVFRNVANGPIKLLVETFSAVIEDRMANTKPGQSVIIPRASSLTIFPGGGFNEKAYDGFKTRTSGTITFSILYGHPEYGYSRKAEKTVSVELFKRVEKKKKVASINWYIRRESDISIE